jgi:calcineurin-like phosphoesterase family protein
MTIFFTSDTHFGHTNVIKYCNRPFADVPAMNVALTANWNSVVGPDDAVYHLGDFAMGPKSEHPKLFQALNGHKHLIRGNHDQSIQKMLAQGWETVSDSAVLTLDGLNLYLAHIPLGNDAYEGRYYPPELVKPPPYSYDYWLCGYVHGAWVARGNVLNVGVDVRGYRPVTLQQLLST